VETTMRRLGVPVGALTLPVSLGAALLLAGSTALFAQATRPEVYALQAALVALAIERTVHHEADAAPGDARALYVAALATGLGLACHPFLALLTGPALAPSFARLLAARPVRRIVLCSTAVVAGMLAYLLLPIRATAGAWPSLGDPRTLERFVWVVSAEAFHRNTGSGVPEPAGQRVADVLVAIGESLGPVVPLVALGGAWVLLRAPGARRLGWVWVTLVPLYALGRAWLGFVRGNPDALGYLVPCLAALVALAAAFVGAVLVALPAARRGLRGLVATLALLTAPLLVASTWREHAAPRFAAPDSFDQLLRRAAPLRAILVAYHPQTAFLLWGRQAVERDRPDLTLVAVPFAGYPGMAEALTRDAPELAPLLRALLLDGAPSRSVLESLASARPVLVELDPRLPLDVWPVLAPQGPWHEVEPGGAHPEAVRRGADEASATWAWLLGVLGDETRDPETAAQILWRRFHDALLLALGGHRERALRAASDAAAVNPVARELVGLRDALAAGDGPLDIRPFLPGAAR
ncbi:MAG: DUF2723 domain-containing protein, partial [Myxococcota bacterium]|nr:DUF2723 domain-containing protein [Myxococcota bacterium]